NPTVAAKALGTLDVISGGRLILGAAAGWYAREFDAVGVPFKQRGRLFERNLDILTRLWTEDRVTVKQDELNLREAIMRPRPVQRQALRSLSAASWTGCWAGWRRRASAGLLHSTSPRATVGRGERSGGVAGGPAGL